MKENKAESACNSVKYMCDKSKILMQSLIAKILYQIFREIFRHNSS